MAALVAARAYRRARPVERIAEGVASLRLPAHFNPWSPRSTWLGTSLRFTRDDPWFWHMGSSTPYRADLVVIQVVPHQMRRLGDDVFRGLQGGLQHVENATWGPWEARGAWKLRIGEGRYTANTMDAPSWLALAVDPARALVLSYRVWKSSASRDDVIALLEQVMASYRPAGDVDAYFASLPRDPGAGVNVSLPVELWDPFPWEFDASGVAWLYYRLDRQWAEDPELPEQAIAVATFFRPGDAVQAAAAREILMREAGQGLADVPAATADDATVPVVHDVVHVVGARREPAWLVTRIDTARGVGLAYRPWQRDRDRAAAVAVVERSVASYRFTGDSTFFDAKPSEP